MISYTYVIKDENGMHARPAAMLHRVVVTLIVQLL